MLQADCEFPSDARHRVKRLTPLSYNASIGAVHRAAMTKQVRRWSERTTAPSAVTYARV